MYVTRFERQRQIACTALSHLILVEAGNIKHRITLGFGPLLAPIPRFGVGGTVMFQSSGLYSKSFK